jgi:hypothetical protein
LRSRKEEQDFDLMDFEMKDIDLRDFDFVEFGIGSLLDAFFFAGILGDGAYNVGD